MRALALAVAALAAIGTAADAQVAGRRPPVDSTRRAAVDTTKKDSLSLALPDSVMRALLARPGFLATRFQGDSVKYDATNERLHLYGKPAFVVRVETRITGDSVRYEETLKRFFVGGSPAIVHDPARGEDIIAYKPIEYDIQNQTGSACDVRTSANSGSVWHVAARCSGFVADSSGGIVYARNARLSTDPRVDGDSADWTFDIGEMKRKGSSLIVGKPATLRIGEVPVLWIPWFLQDMRKGRRSGILTPRFGIAELVRNSPSYRRTLENLGIYFALNDYLDTQVSMDWRSSARPTDVDPGWVTWHADLRYKWLNRFIDGNVGVSHTSQSNGQNNLVVSWNHSQSFSQRTSLRSTLQYAANTSVQRNTTINPFAVAASILSTANYQTEFGSLRTSIGGSQRQYLGREQIDRDFPTLNIASKPIELGPGITWTPSLNSSTSQSLHMDGPSEFGFRYRPLPGGGIDSTSIDRSERTTRMSFNTPLKVGDFTISMSARLTDHERNEPAAKIVIDPADTSIRRTIVFDRTYMTQFDWDLGVNLPQFFSNTLHLTPSVTLRNVDPAGALVRSERTGNRFVSQSKRVAYGVGISPTVYRLFGGAGVFERIRHSISPTFSYSYSPAATVSDEFLAALGRTRAGYLGTLAQNRVSLSLSTALEAKAKPREGDTTTDPASQRTIRLLSVQVTPLEYDFERARVTGRSGFATERLGYALRSDLLPGFDFSADYSLFDAPVISDTARFKPHLESINASLSLTRNAGLLAPVRKFFAWITGERPQERATGDSAAAAAGAAATVAGTEASASALVGGRSRPAIVDVPTGQGFQASLTFTAQRPRAPRGDNVIAVDPTVRCQPFRDTNPLQYDICVRQQTSFSGSNPDLSTGGGVAFRYPNQTSIGGRMSFNLTENWALNWQTNYDVERNAFATQIVSAQRDMGDWRAIFGFMQAPNGNFAFNFMITLKPAPDLKLDYQRRSYRAQGVSGQQ
ncbi:MAG TPA: putative LPS assembly protein LptD [Gemmatimonadaceae bacterium]|nr:putative LPS assembly protein LptD [Gemmatimonadaceae bacterium]